MLRKTTLILLISSLIGCTTANKKTIISDPKDLIGTWKLISILEDTTGIRTTERWPGITLDYNERTVYGYSGCNSFGGDFNVKKDTLKFGDLMANQRGCLNSIEADLFAQLVRVKSYRVNKDSLKFFARDTMLLSFTRDRINKKF